MQDLIKEEAAHGELVWEIAEEFAREERMAEIRKKMEGGKGKRKAGSVSLETDPEDPAVKKARIVNIKSSDTPVATAETAATSAPVTPPQSKLGKNSSGPAKDSPGSSSQRPPIIQPPRRNPIGAYLVQTKPSVVIQDNMVLRDVQEAFQKIPLANEAAAKLSASQHIRFAGRRALVIVDHMARIETTVAMAEEAIKSDESLKAKVVDLEWGKAAVADELNRVQAISVDRFNRVAELEKELAQEKDEHRRTRESLYNQVLLYGERLHALYAKHYPQFELAKPDLKDVPSISEGDEFFNSEDPDALLENWLSGEKDAADGASFEAPSDPIVRVSVNPPEGHPVGLTTAGG